MPKRGAKPLPTTLKLLRGTLRKDRVNAQEPRVSCAIPPCPRELSLGAKREWRRIARELAAAGLLARIDRAALALLCEHWARWIEAIQMLQRHGVVVKSANGYPQPSPFLAVANKAAEQVRLMLSEFGMTPSARSRVHAGPGEPEEESKWAGLLGS